MKVSTMSRFLEIVAIGPLKMPWYQNVSNFALKIGHQVKKSSKFPPGSMLEPYFKGSCCDAWICGGEGTQDKCHT